MEQILSLLHKDIDDTTRLYALVDRSVNDPELHEILDDYQLQKASLFTGELARLNHAVAPYLVCLDGRDDIEKSLIVRGWGRHWGIFLTSDADAEVLLAHCRIVLSHEVEKGHWVFLRFYDPRVLADYLPLLSGKQVGRFFGPVKRFVFESNGGLPVEFKRPGDEFSPNIEDYNRLLDTRMKKELEASWKKREQRLSNGDSNLLFLNGRRI